jgi:NhaP-type Na+/H+ or K+/H+ antiporter
VDELSGMSDNHNPHYLVRSTLTSSRPAMFDALPLQLAPPIYLAGMLALGVGAQWMAWRFRLPAIVLLLFLGLGWGWLVGPPENYLGRPEGGNSILYPLVSLAVGVILFEGGLNLQFREIRDSRGVVIRLVSIGLLVTAILSTLAAHYLVGFSWSIALLMGSLLSVSGPTVILPLIRQVRPQRRTGSIVKWEGIVNDPIGAVLAALVFEGVRHGTWDPLSGNAVVELLQTVVVGVGLGLASAWVVMETIRQYSIPDFLQNPAVLSLVVLVFALSNYLQPESGLVTVTVLGVFLANQRQVAVNHVIEFKENLRVLLLAMLFIALGSNIEINADQLQKVGWGGLAFVAALILVIRPLAVWVSTRGSGLTREECLFLAWMHPRGIVAASVTTLFGLEIAKSNPNLEEEAQLMVLMVFLVILTTVTAYGTTIGPLARRLGLSRENPQGILFAGASPVIRAIAQAVRDEGFPTLLVDTNPQNIAAARMAGLPVSYASIGSEYVHQETDLGDLGRLLAMTSNDEVNTLAVNEFASQFGRAGVYQLAPTEKASERHQRVPQHLRGRILFAPAVTTEELRHLFEAGAQIKRSTLTDDYTYTDFQEMYGDSAILMFVIPEKGKLIVRTTDTKYEPKKGDRLIALVPNGAATPADLEGDEEMHHPFAGA